MEYNTLQKFVSKPRLDRLFIACGNSEEKALKLYKLNLKISQQAYPLLSLFEIFFRNAVYDQLSYYFDDKNWILNQKSGFMSDPSLSQGHFHMREAVIKAENLINKKGINYNEVLSELKI